MPRYDSVLVSAASGAGKNIYTRDRKAFRRLLVETVRLHWRLQREWPRLAAQYRASMDALTSPEQWRAHFEEASR